jgi:hypothetical protein
VFPLTPDAVHANVAVVDEVVDAGADVIETVAPP